MMKTILLLSFAVFTNTVSSAALRNDKHLLVELIEELNTTMHRLPKKDVFLKNLRSDLTCKHTLFCQAEEELVKKVSVLSDFNDFRTDKKLMRNLNMYNKLNGKRCKPIDEDLEEIGLHSFLRDLMACVQSEYSQKKSN